MIADGDDDTAEKMDVCSFVRTALRVAFNTCFACPRSGRHAAVVKDGIKPFASSASVRLLCPLQSASARRFNHARSLR
jgi:hypothetical protein